LTIKNVVHLIAHITWALDKTVQYIIRLWMKGTASRLEHSFVFCWQ